VEAASAAAGFQGFTCQQLQPSPGPLAHRRRFGLTAAIAAESRAWPVSSFPLSRAPSGGIRPRLLLILGLATAAVLIASAVALVALLQIRADLATVTERALPATDAALVLARVGERLQDRTPALLAARDMEARRRQTELIGRDLRLLAAETERLVHLHPGGSGGVDEIARLAPALAANLRDLAAWLEQRTAHASALMEQRAALMALRERVQQALGPSILAVSDAVARPADVGDALFRRAAAAQGPLLEAERLAGAAFRELLIGAAAPDAAGLERSQAVFGRTRDQLSALIARIPGGLRAELGAAVADLDGQLGAEGVFAQRRDELAALAAADRLVDASRRIAVRLKTLVDALVLAANENISRAAGRMGDGIVANTVRLVAVSIAVLLLATLFSYRFVVRDISLNLRAVTGAMQRLAAGERGARVPAMERRDEIGDLARVFDVFKEQAFEVQALHRELVDKSSLLMTTFDSMNDGFTLFDAGGRLMAWNPRVLKLYGLSDDDLRAGADVTAIHRTLAAKGVRFFTPQGDPVALPGLSEGRTRYPRAFDARCPAGRAVELRSNPTPDGGFVTLHADVTERRAIEDQLRQAQKMEAVGQLTGSIAHDFNNILGAILGNLSFLEPAPGDAPERRERWQRAMGAADRAARQVERLLAFARRQRLAPEVVDINALAAGMLDLLEVSVGDRVELRAVLAPDLPPVRVDPGQLENALMNLALNARDAMAGDGRLTITTAAAGTGLVEVAVADTGGGIPPELVERVCEPFFTTKPKGKGSGLGLSLVYGFARQSGGAMVIDTAPGQGTTVRIRLPVAGGADGPEGLSEPPEPDAPLRRAGDGQERRGGRGEIAAGGSFHMDLPGGQAEVAAGDRCDAELPRGRDETLLVVDDDADLLESTAAQLRGLGYRVLTAGDGAAALAQLAREPGIRLLYTDVRMPGALDGIGLAREALARRPDLALLFTSGEAREVLDPAAELLPKPVPLPRLAQAIRRLLHRRDE